MIPSLIVLGKARHLDRVMPGWADRIDTEYLNLDHDYDCVLGQLYGTFQNAPLLLGGMMLCPFILSFAFLSDLLPGSRKYKTWIACIERRQTVYVPKEWSIQESRRVTV